MIEMVTHRGFVNRGHVSVHGGLQPMGAEGAQQDGQGAQYGGGAKIEAL
jgi:hypothetical protein